MDFLKRYYERFILLGLFLVFIALMFYVHAIIDETRKVNSKDLELKKREADHEVVDPKDARFDVSKLQKDTALNWNAAALRDSDAKFGKENFSDLVNVFAIAECPFCAANQSGDTEQKRLIPFSMFGAKCVFCGHDLKKPAAQQRARIRVRTAEDNDGDGISNTEENMHRLNSSNPNDALYDNDGDGFSNYHEIIVSKTNPNDAADHPPFWHRLRLVDIKQIELPIELMVLNDNGKNEKSEWEIQYNVPRPGRRPATFFARLGETLTIERRDYKIVNIERIREKQKVEAGNLASKDGYRAEREIDKSRVYLEEVIDQFDENRKNKVPDKLVMVVKKPVYSSDKRPVLGDCGVPDGSLVYTVKPGVRFKMNGIGDMARKYSSNYEVIAVDAEKMAVTLRDPRARRKPGEEPEVLLVTREGKIAPADRVIERRPEDTATAQFDDTIL